MCIEHENWIDDTSLCDNCYNNLTAECAICGEVHLQENMLYIDEEWVCSNCQDGYISYCENCAEEHLIDNMVEDEDTGGYYCKECWEEREKEKEENV